MVELMPSKHLAGVRFPSVAPEDKSLQSVSFRSFDTLIPSNVNIGGESPKRFLFPMQRTSLRKYTVTAPIAEGALGIS